MYMFIIYNKPIHLIHGPEHGDILRQKHDVVGVHQEGGESAAYLKPSPWYGGLLLDH